MKNVTISMDDKLMQLTRVEAAKAGKSMSRLISEMLEQRYRQDFAQSDEEKRRRLDRLQRIFDGPMWDVMENGRMPNADERNAPRRPSSTARHSSTLFSRPMPQSACRHGLG